MEENRENRKSRKVFLSVLGTGFYRKCVYQFNGVQSTSGRFIQASTLEILKTQEKWTSDDVVYILTTQKAKDVNWNPKDRKRKVQGSDNEYEEYIGLKDVLKDLDFPASIMEYDIPDGKNENEMWEIFQIIFKLLHDKDELYLDLTHSFRYLPMLLLVLGNYSKFLKDIKLKSITYGNYEARDLETNVAPIMDLLPLAMLQDWTNASANYLENGRADQLSSLTREKLQPLLREYKGKNLNVSNLKKFTDNLCDFTNELLVCRGKDIYEAQTIHKLLKSKDNMTEVVLAPMEPLIDEIVSSVKELDNSNPAENGFAAARWCYEHRLFQQSITLLQESVATAFCQKYGLDIMDKRGLINSAFAIVKNGFVHQPSKWKVDKKSEDEDRRILQYLVATPEINDLSNLFDECSQIRNDYNHAGWRSNAQSAKKLINQIGEILDSFEKRICDLSFSKNIGEMKNGTELKSFERILINFTNHPYEDWSTEQKQAAVSFGNVIDLPFPMISPEASSDEIRSLTNEYVHKIEEISENKIVTVHVMGEMNFVFSIVTILKAKGYRCIASTTDRDVQINEDGIKTAIFKFHQFRDY